MSRSSSYLYTAFVVALWGAVLPGILIRDESGAFDVPLRSPVHAVLAVFLLVLATVLVFYPARQLVRAGVGPFGVAPGPVLLTTAWYGRIRNPIDVGATLIAVAAWIAFDVELMWVVPVAALATFTVGSGLYEDRRLFEVFGDDFDRYRRQVRKWFPVGRPESLADD